MRTNTGTTLWCAYAFILSFLTRQQALAISAAQDEAIDTAVNEFMESNRIPGLTLGIVDNSARSFYATAYGLRDIENQLPVENKTLFSIGSITKSFTAILAVRILSQKFPDLGEAVLDTPLVDLAPDFNSTFIDRFRHQSTTFRDLLSHRTCLKNPDLQILFGAFNGSVEEATYRLRYLNEVCSFRERYEYNNGMYALAGEITASLAGLNYRVLLQGLLDELGMSDTILFDPSVDYETLPDMARGYYSRDDEILKYNSEIFKVVTMLNPAGGILSTSRDMVKYLSFHLNYGKVDGVEVVPEEVMKWLHRGSVLLRVSAFKESLDDIVDINYAYALALMLGSANGWEVSSHGGSLPPFSSFFSVYPGANVGIFSAFNGPSSYIDRAPLHATIFRILISGLKSSRELAGRYPKSKHNQLTGFPKLIPFQPQLNSGSAKHTAPFNPADLPGTFGNAAYGESIVTYDGATLEFHYGRWFSATMRLVDEANNIYVLEYTGNKDLESILLLQSGGLVADIPAIYMQFIDLSTLWFVEPANLFVRDEGLNDYPAQPWAPGSCGPEP